MLDGRYQCLTCSRHITGIYQGKEHAPHLESSYGEVVIVQPDQAGRIPICDKCTRPVTTSEEAYRHDTRYYHLECARCNRCRKKLFNVPCRKLGSALGNRYDFDVLKVSFFLSFSLSYMFIKIIIFLACNTEKVPKPTQIYHPLSKIILYYFILFKKK